MKLYVGITDNDRFKLHASKESLGEVNFWRPSDQPYRKDFQPGMPFLFKLHAPDSAIVGGGFFLKFLALPLSLAWGTLGEANGAKTFEELRALISKRRAIPIKPNEDPIIGCTILGEPFFFDDSDWIPGERYLKGPIVSGKGNFDSDTALALWREVTPRLERARAKTLGPATVAALDRRRYGSPTLVAPRLGQGSFRALVTDAYRYRCAMTSERTLPVLEAAHIRPFADGGEHALSNGLLLRSDLHTLFDLGYVTVDPKEKKILVSDRIKSEFENGREYYKLRGERLVLPENPLAIPSIAASPITLSTSFAADSASIWG
jgi:putative restriction endonuclease